MSAECVEAFPEKRGAQLRVVEALLRIVLCVVRTGRASLEAAGLGGGCHLLPGKPEMWVTPARAMERCGLRDHLEGRSDRTW